MKTAPFSFIVAIVICMALAHGPSAQATVFSVNGVPQLVDDYEAPEGVVGSVPVAKLGVWDAVTTATVADGSTTLDVPNPGPYGGNQFLSIGESQKVLNVMADDAFDFGETVEIKTWAYLSSAVQDVNDAYQFEAFDSHGNYTDLVHAPMVSTIRDGTVNWYDGSA